MNKCITIPQTQIPRLLDGSMTGMIVPMRKQPSPDWTLEKPIWRPPTSTLNGYIRWMGLTMAGGILVSAVRRIDKLPYRCGDVLRVREVWRIGAWTLWHNGSPSVAIDYQADNHLRREWLPVKCHEVFERLWTESTREAEISGVKPNNDDGYDWEPGQSPCRWRSPQTMPAEYSRISFHLKADPVPVRVCEVTETQMIAMGTGHIYYVDDILAARRYAFEQYWEYNYGKRYPYSTAWGWWMEFETEVKRNA